jgi:hypothetical protein
VVAEAASRRHARPPAHVDLDLIGVGLAPVDRHDAYGAPSRTERRRLGAPHAGFGLD